MTKALVLSGQGRYEDPWHDYAGTSWRIAKLLEELGLTVTLRGLARLVLANLDEVDLLVVNAGGWKVDADFDGPETEWELARAGLDAYIASGRPLLGVHAAAQGLRDNPRWASILGGMWTEQSWHPDIGPTELIVTPEAHPIAAGLESISLYDERYTDLVIEPGNTPYLFHDLDGVRHPLAWARLVGDARVVFDALGHGVEAYDSPGWCRLLKREAQWCLGWEPTA